MGGSNSIAGNVIFIGLLGEYLTGLVCQCVENSSFDSLWTSDIITAERGLAQLQDKLELGHSAAYLVKLMSTF